MNKMISYISERNLLSCFLNSCAVKFLWMNVPSKMPMHKPRNKPSSPSLIWKSGGMVKRFTVLNIHRITMEITIAKNTKVLETILFSNLVHNVIYHLMHCISNIYRSSYVTCCNDCLLTFIGIFV